MSASVSWYSGRMKVSRHASLAVMTVTLCWLPGCRSSSGPDDGAVLEDGGVVKDALVEVDLAAADLSGPGDVIKFVAVGDTGKGNDGQKQVGAAIATFCASRGCDFVQLLGDNIYESGISSPSDSQMQDKFEIPYAQIDLPFWVVLGNHDYGGNGLGNEFGKGQNEVDYTALSTKWKLPSAYWHRSDKRTEFFALDTNMIMWNLSGNQAADVRGWLEASTATWKIVLGHHPYLSNGKHGNAGNYDGLPSIVPIASGKNVKDFMEAVVCGRADVYICGHDHDRQWLTGTCQGTELMISGAGASVTGLEGSNPTHFEKDTLGFLYVTIIDRTLTGEFVDVNGNVEFTRTLTK